MFIIILPVLVNLIILLSAVTSLSMLATPTCHVTPPTPDLAPPPPPPSSDSSVVGLTQSSGDERVSVSVFPPVTDRFYYCSWMDWRGSMRRGRGACWDCSAVWKWIVREGEDERGGFWEREMCAVNEWQDEVTLSLSVCVSLLCCLSTIWKNM